MIKKCFIFMVDLVVEAAIRSNIDDYKLLAEYDFGLKVSREFGQNFDIARFDKYIENRIQIEKDKKEGEVKIIIEIRGGNLSAVHSNQNISYVVLDWDNIKSEDNTELTVYSPDIISGDLWKLYYGGSVEKSISAELKKSNF